MSRTTDMILKYQSGTEQERRELRAEYPEFFNPKAKTPASKPRDPDECSRCRGKGWHEFGAVGYRREVDCYRCSGTGRNN